MFFSDICTLVDINETKNSYGATINSEKEKTVFCNKKSVGMNESYELSRLGFKGELKIEINKFDYSDEEFIIYNSKKYKIQRTYEREDEVIELTCIKVI